MEGSTELEKLGGVIRKEVSEITLKILLYFFSLWTVDTLVIVVPA